MQRKLAQEQRENNEILLTELRPDSKSVGKPHFLPECLSIDVSIDDFFNFVSHSDPPPNFFFCFFLVHIGLGWVFYGL